MPGNDAMPLNQIIKSIVVTLTSALLLTGCLERTERIIVNEDGSVDIQATFKGEQPDDFDNEDRLPKPGGSWIVEESSQPNTDGEEVYTRTATRRLPAGAELPSTFGERSEPNGKAYLQFPTTLRIDRRSDGTYYHFARTYEARDFAQAGYLQELADKELQKFGQKSESGQPLTRSDWRAISEQMVKVAIQKYQVWARQAFVETQPYAPQDAWLGVVTALEQFRRNVDYDTIATLIQQNVDAGENAQANIFEQLAGELERSTIDTINSALTSHPNTSGTSAFRQRMAFHQKAWEVTQDLNDEKFNIRVEMPGQIVAHNGDSRANNVVRWTFGGEFLHDRKIELLVTSKIPN